MIRNIDLLLCIQESIHKIYFLADDIAVKCEMQQTTISRLIDVDCKTIQSVLTCIDDIDRILDSLTEDIKDSMLNEGFDSDDYKIWNTGLLHDRYRLEGMIESIVDALKVLELYILETVRGYKILTQLAYDKNPRLPGLKQRANGS